MKKVPLTLTAPLEDGCAATATHGIETLAGTEEGMKSISNFGEETGTPSWRLVVQVLISVYSHAES